MDWSNYDYNGVIFVFGRVDNSVTSHWKDVIRVEMSVDSTSNFAYSANIKEIPYTQKTNFNGDDCVNNTQCKIFNINTFAHRKNNDISYQFSSGEHTCYLRFYYSDSDYVSTSVSVIVHATLKTPSVSVDEESGVVSVKRSSTSGSPRYYIEIRRKNREKINSSLPWQDKDYIHTVALKGVEGGKYNEGIPHTGFMLRGESDIAASNLQIKSMPDLYYAKSESDTTITPLSVDSDTPTEVNCDIDIPYESIRKYSYYVFTAPAKATYHFTCSEGSDLRCELYSDSGYSNFLADSDDTGISYSFSLCWDLNEGETIYIKIQDYSRNKVATILRINTVTTEEISEFTPRTIQPHNSVRISISANSSGYVTLYPAKKAKGLIIDKMKTKGDSTPYHVLPVEESKNEYAIYNSSSQPVTYWITEVHSDLDYQPYWRVNPITGFNAAIVFDDETIMKKYGGYCVEQVNDALTKLATIISETSGTSVTVPNIENMGASELYVAETIESTGYSGRYVTGTRIASDSSKTLYYALVDNDSIYRVDYNHDTLYYATSINTGTSITEVLGDSSMLWYEAIGGDYGVDENTLVVRDDASGYYVLSNSEFTLKKVVGVSDCFDDYYDEFGGYNILIRFGLDGTTWMGKQGIATSGNGGNSADINGQGKWMNMLYYDSARGVDWSYAIINVDNSDLFETMSHVIHEEIAQSLGLGNDCYSREESIHWDPEQANPDYYVGIDKTVLDFAYASNKNGYTQFDLCNEYDLPITLFKEYSNCNSENIYQFRLKDAGGNWLLRSDEYEVYAWCVGMGEGDGSIAGSDNDGWDDDPYSLRSASVSFSVEGGWYWSDYNIDMKNGGRKLKVSDVHHTIWNEFVDAVKKVMNFGNIPENDVDYGSAAGLPFAEAIEKAKMIDTIEGRTLTAQKFNVVNYIINSKVETGIGVQKSLTSQVFAEYMEKLQDCRNLM